MAVLETHIFKAHNNIYIEQPCRLPRLLTQQGLTTIERVDDAG